MSQHDLVLHTPIFPDNEPQLTARAMREYARPHLVGKELIGRVIGVDELDDLLVGHARAALTPQGLLLLQAPAVDVFGVGGVDVDEGVEQVGEAVVGP